MRRIACVLVVVMGGVGAVGGGGCTGLEPAMIGAAATGAQTAIGIFKRGKLDAVDASPIGQLTDATRQTIAGLGLTVVSEEQDADRYYVEARDLQGDWVVVELTRQTDRLTAIRLNVGWFGSEPTASLVLAQILARQHPDLMPVPLRRGLPRVPPPPAVSSDPAATAPATAPTAATRP